MNTHFFQSMYQEIPSSQAILVWSKEKGSKWASSFEQAEELALSMHGCNTYYGVCLATPRKSSKERAKATDVTFAPGLWVDVDVKSPHHSKQNLPPSLDEALDCLNDACPLSPSAVVATGGGFHAYWFFNELLDLNEDGARLHFAAVIQAWQTMIRNAFRAKGWDVDATHDLARVLRVPGTFNVNENAQCDVTSLWENLRYELDEFEQYVDIEAVPDAESLVSSDYSSVHCIPAPGMGLSPALAEKVKLLCSFSDTFNLDWQHKNPNLQDDSQSSYDISMANIMVSQEEELLQFTDQEICDVLIAHRLKYAATPQARRKAWRVDYYRRTIAAAREFMRQKAGEMSAPPADVAPAVPQTEPGRQANPDAATPAQEENDELARRFEEWDKMGRILELTISMVTIFENAEPTPKICIRGTNVSNGRSGEILMPLQDMSSKAKFSSAYLNAFFTIPSRLDEFKPKQWQSGIVPFINSAEIRRLDDEETDEGLVKIYLIKRIFASCHGDLNDLALDVSTKVSNEMPFMSDDTVYATAAGVFREMRSSGVTTLASEKEVYRIMKNDLRLRKHKASYYVLDERFQKWAFIIPQHIYEQALVDTTDGNSEPFND